ncbi:MAG: glutathione peroxidase [Bacteroidota bacterium]|jgi:glutathione peroxidase
MKKLILPLLITFFLFTNMNNNKTFYNLSAKTIDGSNFDFSTLKGKKVLIVNTASECGFTPQYETLEKLYNTYKSKNFVILGFPANNFGGQEPGTNTQIKEFCKKNYGVSFQMMEKISVKGSDMHPVYQWLTKKSENGKMDCTVRWNFEKFIIDENGNLVDNFASMTSPMSDKITSWIEGK